MTSVLHITSVEKLVPELAASLNGREGGFGVCISLNKPSESTKTALKKAGVKTSRLFFIDCVTSQIEAKDVVHIAPKDLAGLGYALKCYLEEIGGEKFIAIDALSTLLIYNDEKSVVQFVKELTELAEKYDADLIALSPRTQGEEMLANIYNFFTEVKGKR